MWMIVSQMIILFVQETLGNLQTIILANRVPTLTFGYPEILSIHLWFCMTSSMSSDSVGDLLEFKRRFYFICVILFGRIDNQAKCTYLEYSCNFLLL